MRKGYSFVVTATDSGSSHHLFLSNRFLRLILAFLAIVIAVLIFAALNYGIIYYRALQFGLLKRRNAEIEKEFTKVNEIKKNLEIAEMDNRKIKIMLGIEKTPTPVEPTVNETSPNVADRTASTTVQQENIPSLLPTSGPISRNFGPGHYGIDIAAPRFAPVIATASGIVAATDWDSLYGNYAIIRHNQNYVTFYGHLNSIAVKKGDAVIIGTVIGTIGSSGRSTSPHLHYEVRFRDKPVDPMGYVPYFVKF